MQVYRISKCRFIDDLSGYGAAQSGGRWNSPGVYMLYVSESAALALLENIVNNTLQLRMPFCQVTLELPASNIPVVDVDNLPPGWNRYPPAAVLKAIGDSFIRSGEHLALKVPSAIMSGQWNYLINPAHPDAESIQIISREKITIDERLKTTGAG